MLQRRPGNPEMTFRRLYWLWVKSAVAGDGCSVTKALLRRIRFNLTALRSFEAVQPFFDAQPGSSLAKLMAERPEAIGAVVWPYQCLAWDTSTRLARICEHYRIIDGGPLDITTHEKLLLLDLPEIKEGLYLALDRPQWFLREGEIAINLFLSDTRIYSLVFSLFEESSGISAFIGAIQGRDLHGIMDEYRSLTRAANGMRPRDLLIELFRMYCAVANIDRIRAISDEYRQHRSPYYGSASEKKIHGDYDAIWTDRGGTKLDAFWYDLPVEAHERSLDEISSKKRSMYRKRYHMLNALRIRMGDKWSELTAS